jgi:hypothetical protein
VIARALTLGLSTGFFCLGTCAPVLMALFASGEKSRLRTHAGGLVVFLAGRLLGYCLFGAASYAAGQALGIDGTVVTVLLPLGDVLLGSVMLIHATGCRLPHLISCRTAHRWFGKHNLLFAAGFFTGINLCPPFLLAVTQAMRGDSLLQSVAFFAVFFLTTSLYLVPFVLTGLTARFAEIRFAARIACGIGGAWFIVRGVGLVAASY